MTKASFSSEYSYYTIFSIVVSTEKADTAAGYTDVASSLLIIRREAWKRRPETAGAMEEHCPCLPEEQFRRCLPLRIRLFCAIF
jgi:hypothetical protein